MWVPPGPQQGNPVSGLQDCFLLTYKLNDRMPSPPMLVAVDHFYTAAVELLPHGMSRAQQLLLAQLAAKHPVAPAGELPMMPAFPGHAGFAFNITVLVKPLQLIFSTLPSLVHAPRFSSLPSLSPPCPVE